MSRRIDPQFAEAQMIAAGLNLLSHIRMPFQIGAVDVLIAIRLSSQDITECSKVLDVPAVLQ